MSSVLRRSVLAVLLGTVLLGCHSTGSSSKAPAKTGVPVRVSWHDYRSDQVLELVNESHTDRLEQYSKLRETAGRKVQTDEIISALVEHMHTPSYAKLWMPGAAPAKSNGDWLWSLEIESPSGTQFVAEPAGLPVEEKLLRRELRQAFIDTYNLTYSLQAVKVKEGETPFSAPEPGKPTKQ